MVLAACGGNGESGEESGSVNISLPNHAWTDLVQDYIPQFEEETGISVNLTTFGEDQLSDQYNVALNTGSTDFDVMMYRPLQEGSLFTLNGWLSNLDEYIADDDWEWQDFQEGPVEAVVGDDGSVYGVPLVTERQVLYYNSEILEDAGVEVPTTLDELWDAAEATHDPENGVYGFVARGQRSAGVTQLSSFLYSMGGSWDDIASEEAIEAYELYGSLLREFGPDGTTEMNWLQALPVFAQGTAAFYTDADSLYNNFMDPDESRVTETIGFAMFPEGPAGSRPYNIPSWALGISEFSENKENAWEFVRWITSPEMSLEIQSGGVPLARTSVWENPESSENMPDELVDVINASAEIGIGHDRPQVVRVAEARDIVGTPMVVSIQDGDVRDAAATAAEEYAVFLESDG